MQRDALSAPLGRLALRIVGQRPDVRAAESQLHSASANLGVAIPDMLAQITFPGTLGGTATAAGQIVCGRQ